MISLLLQVSPMLQQNNHNLKLYCVTHPIHSFKSSDWLKEGHMIWISFDDVHVWKLIHVCQFLLFPDSRRSCYSCRIWNFYSLQNLLQTTKSKNGVYKTNIDCSFIRGMVENYCTLGKIQPWPTIHLGQVKVEFHLGNNNFPPFPS